MTDSYQAIYDATRSRIGSVDSGSVIEAVERAFDISWQKQHLQEAIHIVSNEMTRPSVVFRPALSADGDMWCALLGDDLQVGVAGFGKTPAEAMTAFDQAFWNDRTPKAIAMEARSGETACGLDPKDDSAGPSGHRPTHPTQTKDGPNHD